MELHLRAAGPSESLCTEVSVPQKRQPPPSEPRQFNCYCIPPQSSPPLAATPATPYFSVAIPSFRGMLILILLRRSPCVIPPSEAVGSIYVYLILVDSPPAWSPPIFRHICDMHYSNINVFSVIATAFSPYFAPHESLGDLLSLHSINVVVFRYI